MKNIESEKSVEAFLKKSIEKDLKGRCIKMLSAHMNGLPDRICLIPGGKVFFAEVKTTNQKPRKIQLIVHRVLKNLGFRVEIIETKSRVKQIVMEYANAE